MRDFWTSFARAVRRLQRGRSVASTHCINNSTPVASVRNSAASVRQQSAAVIALRDGAVASLAQGVPLSQAASADAPMPVRRALHAQDGEFFSRHNHAYGAGMGAAERQLRRRCLIAVDPD